MLFLLFGWKMTNLGSSYKVFSSTLSSLYSCVCMYMFFFFHFFPHYPSVQFSSVTQSCPTLCDPVNHSTPGLPIHHQLPEFTETHVHRVSDAIQPSHPLSSIYNMEMSQHILTVCIAPSWDSSA